MFKKLLVCTDLSRASEVLLDCICQLKELGLEEVVLAHVVFVDANACWYESLGLEVGDPHKTPRELYKEHVREKSRPLLERQKERLEEKGLTVTAKIPTGLPAKEINRLAEDYDVSAILIGCSGKGILTKAVLGSVSSEIIKSAKRPVLLQRIKLRAGEQPVLAYKNLFTHALFFTDFSEIAAGAYEYLKKVVKDTKCPVTLAHVQEGATLDPHLLYKIEHQIDSNKDMLKAYKEELEQLGSPQVEIEMPIGSLSKGISSVLERGNFSMIIMGTQGKGFIKEAFLGSFSYKVARISSSPNLLIPAKRD